MAFSVDDFIGIAIFLGVVAFFIVQIHSISVSDGSSVKNVVVLNDLKDFIIDKLEIHYHSFPFIVSMKNGYSGNISINFNFSENTDENSVVVKKDSYTILLTDADLADNHFKFNSDFQNGNNLFELFYLEGTNFESGESINSFNNSEISEILFLSDEGRKIPFDEFQLNINEIKEFLESDKFNISIGIQSIGKIISGNSFSSQNLVLFIDRFGNFKEKNFNLVIWK